MSKRLTYQGTHLFENARVGNILETPNDDNIPPTNWKVFYDMTRTNPGSGNCWGFGSVQYLCSGNLDPLYIAETPEGNLIYDPNVKMTNYDYYYKCKTSKTIAIGATAGPAVPSNANVSRKRLTAQVKVFDEFDNIRYDVSLDSGTINQPIIITDPPTQLIQSYYLNFLIPFHIFIWPYDRVEIFISDYLG